MGYSFQEWQAGAPPPKDFDAADRIDYGWSNDEIRTMRKELLCDDLPEWHDDEPMPSSAARGFSFSDWQAGVRPPKGWDGADACADGWTNAELTAMMREAVTSELLPFPEEPSNEVQGPAMDVFSDLQARSADIEPEPASGAPADRLPARAEAPPRLKPWVFLRGPNRFRHCETGEEMSVSAFDMAFQTITPEVDTTVAGRVLKSPKAVSPSTWLVGYAGGRTVADTIYLPAHADGDSVVTVDGVQYLNSYLTAHIPEAASRYAGHWAVDAWSAHLRNVLPKEWQLLLHWLAHNVQNPGKKILWAPIIKGTQGDGKTTISKMLGAVMGQRNVKVVSTESLFSDFTSYAEGSCVAFLEEIRVKGHNRHDAMNKLKPLITNSAIEVVRKGADGRNVPNVTNYMAFTNYEDALVLDENDRRWGVFFTPFGDRAALLAAGMDADYFTRLHQAIDDHADVLRAWLLDVDTAGFDPNAAPPMTAAKAAMIASSASSEAGMVAELVSLGRKGVGQVVLATDCLNEALREEFGIKLPTSRLSTVMGELGWSAAPFQIWWDGKARRVYLNDAHRWPVAENERKAMARSMLDDAGRQIAEPDLRDIELDKAW